MIELIGLISIILHLAFFFILIGVVIYVIIRFGGHIMMFLLTGFIFSLIILGLVLSLLLL